MPRRAFGDVIVLLPGITGQRAAARRQGRLGDQPGRGDLGAVQPRPQHQGPGDPRVRRPSQGRPGRRGHCAALGAGPPPDPRVLGDRRLHRDQEAAVRRAHARGGQELVRLPVRLASGQPGGRPRAGGAGAPVAGRVATGERQPGRHVSCCWRTRWAGWSRASSSSGTTAGASPAIWSPSAPPTGARSTRSRRWSTGCRRGSVRCRSTCPGCCAPSPRCTSCCRSTRRSRTAASCTVRRRRICPASTGPRRATRFASTATSRQRWRSTRTTTRTAATATASRPVVGIFQPTDQSARLVGDRVEMLASYEGGDEGGDGTVPRVSATPIELSDDPRETYVSTTHGSLQNAEAVLSHVVGALTRKRLDRFRDTPFDGFSLDRPRPGGPRRAARGPRVDHGTAGVGQGCRRRHRRLTRGAPPNGQATRRRLLPCHDPATAGGCLPGGRRRPPTTRS